MLGPSHYGIPVGREVYHEAHTGDCSIARYIVTLRNLDNWLCYNLITPGGPRRIPQARKQKTCLKCIAPLLVDFELNFVLAFNRAAIPWNVKGQPKPEFGFRITFLQNNCMISFCAVRKKQLSLREQLIQQERLLGRVAVFAGCIEDIPQATYAKRCHAPEYFDASICPCGSTTKESKAHQKTQIHRDWLLEQQEQQQEHDESEDDDAAGSVAGKWWDD